MFSSTGLFKSIACPEGQDCKLTNCMFKHLEHAQTPSFVAHSEHEGKGTTENGRSVNGGSTSAASTDAKLPVASSTVDRPKNATHDVLRPIPAIVEPPSNTQQHTLELETSKADSPDRPTKRRKLSEVPTSIPTPASHAGDKTTRESTDQSNSIVDSKRIQQHAKAGHSNGNGNGQTGSLKVKTVFRQISPPPSKSAQPHSGTATSKGAQEVKVPLLPIHVAQEPVQYPVRLKYLKVFHDAMVQWNKVVGQSEHGHVRCHVINNNRLRQYAVDQEALIAQSVGAIYKNVLVQKIKGLRAMKEEEWLEVARTVTPTEKKSSAVQTTSPTQQVLPSFAQTHTVTEQLTMAKRLLAPREMLQAYGYLLEPPTKEQVDAAILVNQTAAGYEVCERCSTRFRVYPSRQEDGLLTTHGSCTYHYGRKSWVKRDSANPSRWSCCSALAEEPGCTSSASHVYAFKDAARLAAVWQFDSVQSLKPMKPLGKARDFAVALDCEMGYTTSGFEMIRLSAVTWPDYVTLIDVLVRPFGQVLDLNSRFSGVTPEQFSQAPPLDVLAWTTAMKGYIEGTQATLPHRNAAELSIVESPEAARGLLCDIIKPETPLIGHALDNDLNVLRLIHHNVIDTCIAFPHARGPPYRHALRRLVSQYLKREIQTGTETGHDSVEDSRAAGDLVKWLSDREWARLQDAGWTVKGECFVPLADSGKSGAALPPTSVGIQQNGSKQQGTKRSHEEAS